MNPLPVAANTGFGTFTTELLAGSPAMVTDLLSVHPLASRTKKQPTPGVYQFHC
jgi:hypothetical protein